MCVHKKVADDVKSHYASRSSTCICDDITKYTRRKRRTVWALSFFSLVVERDAKLNLIAPRFTWVNCLLSLLFLFPLLPNFLSSSSSSSSRQKEKKEKACDIYYASLLFLSEGEKRGLPKEKEKSPNGATRGGQTGRRKEHLAWSSLPRSVCSEDLRYCLSPSPSFHYPSDLLYSGGNQINPSLSFSSSPAHDVHTYIALVADPISYR